MNTNKLNFPIVIAIISIPFIFNWIGYHKFLSSPLSIAITSAILTFSLMLSVLKKGLSLGNWLMLLTLVGALRITAAMFNSLGTVFTCYNIVMLTFFV